MNYTEVGIIKIVFLKMATVPNRYNNVAHFIHELIIRELIIRLCKNKVFQQFSNILDRLL
ncbi:MAG: hypothetical protein COA86_05595 [Kangiella sp.]|nr:MAG: hypothetical protein COA86_05595 [Kangiella sp.]